MSSSRLGTSSGAQTLPRGGYRRLKRALTKASDFTIGSVLLLAVWYLVTKSINNPVLFPTPITVAETAWGMVHTGGIWADVAVSGSRIGIGYLFGVLLGLTVGIVLGEVRILDRFISPVIGFVRMLPPVALVPLAIIWFGIGEPSKYFIVMWGTMIAVLYSALDGVHNAPRTRILAARCLGASPLRVVWDVVLPSAIPSIWTGMRISVGLAVSSVVSAELIAANKGIGFIIMNARVLIEINRMFVGLALLAVFGGVADRLFTTLGEYVLHRFLAYVRG